MNQKIFFLCFSTIFLSCSSDVNFQNLYPLASSTLNSSEVIRINEKERQVNLTIEKTKDSLLDILIVVDPSSSMQPHLQKLGKTLGALFTFIPDYDWQMAFITADHGDHENVLEDTSYYEDRWEDNATQFASFGSLMHLETSGRILRQKILNQNTEDYKSIFFDTLSHSPEINCSLPPFCQKYLEQPLRSLKSAMERTHLDNGSFFRPQADLISLIITNEDERSEDSKNATTAKDVVSTFDRLLKPKQKRFFAFNIIIMSETCLQEELKTVKKANIGNKIKELAELTGGFNISICKPNYQENLKSISKYIETIVEKSVEIEANIIPSSLKVRFLNGPPVPWRISGKQLIFEKKLRKSTQIQLHYQVF